MRAIGTNTHRSDPFHAYFARIRVSVPIPIIISASSGEESRAVLSVLSAFASLHVLGGPSGPKGGSLCIGGIFLTIISFDNEE